MNPQSGLEERDLEQIVVLSELRTRPRPPKIPTPSQVVEYSGNLYKVRAYPDSVAAQESRELISAAKHLFIRCYGQIDRFLVLEYIKGNKLDSRQQVLVDIADFLENLSTVQVRQSPQEDFDFLCGNIEAAGIFRPQTMGLIRKYYREASSPSVNWGLEYYDAMPRNFAYAEDGRLVSVDEKHLRTGPRGVSLIKPMEQLSAEDFLELKKAYLAGASAVPFEDPKYQVFLQFYRQMTVLGALAAFREREANAYERSFHVDRQAVLRIVGAPRTLRMVEESRWGQYRVHQAQRSFQKARGFLRRRLMPSGVSSS